MFSVRSDIQKRCGDVVFWQFFCCWFAGILGQMEQCTAIHTKGVLDGIKCFIKFSK